MMQIHRVIPLDDLILKRETLKARQKREPRVFNGPKPYNARKAKPKHPDSLLLEMRRLYEYEELGPKEIAEYLRTKDLVISPGEISSICQYHYRPHLVPETRDAPYWPEVA